MDNVVKRVALVTGASSGIGEAVAERLARQFAPAGLFDGAARKSFKLNVLPSLPMGVRP